MANATRAVDPFTALGDPTRRAVFERVARAPAAVVEIAASLPVSRPAVSQHLKVLKDAAPGNRGSGRERGASIASTRGGSARSVTGSTPIGARRSVAFAAFADQNNDPTKE